MALVLALLLLASPVDDRPRNPEVGGSTPIYMEDDKPICWGGTPASPDWCQSYNSASGWIEIEHVPTGVARRLIDTTLAAQFLGQIQAIDGALATPAIAPASNPDTGIYFSGSQILQGIDNDEFLLLFMPGANRIGLTASKDLELQSGGTVAARVQGGGVLGVNSAVQFGASATDADSTIITDGNGDGELRLTNSLGNSFTALHLGPGGSTSSSLYTVINGLSVRSNNGASYGNLESRALSVFTTTVSGAKNKIGLNGDVGVVNMANDVSFTWGNTDDTATGSRDTGVQRCGAGFVCENNGTLNTAGGAKASIADTDTISDNATPGTKSPLSAEPDSNAWEIDCEDSTDGCGVTLTVASVPAAGQEHCAKTTNVSQTAGEIVYLLAGATLKTVGGTDIAMGIDGDNVWICYNGTLGHWVQSSDLIDITP